jgi:hypothetical protein
MWSRIDAGDGLTAPSATFAVTVGAPDQVVFTVQAGGASGGMAFTDGTDALSNTSTSFEVTPTSRRPQRTVQQAPDPTRPARWPPPEVLPGGTGSWPWTRKLDNYARLR